MKAATSTMATVACAAFAVAGVVACDAVGGFVAGMNWGELGWTLEDNAAVNAGIRMMGAKKYKVYRVYTKDLAAS